MAVMIEIKRRHLRLSRDLILLAEADEEVGSSGIQWMIQNAWSKIDAEFALNEGGSIFESRDGTRVFQIATTEKVPTRIVLTARGTAAHGSLPTTDNPINHLSKAITRITEAEEPVHFNSTTRRYFRSLSKLEDYEWLGQLWPRLDNPATAQAAAAQIRLRDPDLDAMLRTTIAATMLKAGGSPNVIPAIAEAQLDVRRMPVETRDEVLTRFRQVVNDPAVEVALAPGTQMPSTDPSPTMTSLYLAMDRVIKRIYPHDALAVPFMSRGATDGSFLRARGVPVYGVPLFLREPGESRVHGADERIALKSLEDGVELLWQMVLETAGEN